MTVADTGAKLIRGQAAPVLMVSVNQLGEPARRMYQAAIEAA